MLKLQPAGTFHKQLVRCGKPNCKCTKGNLHGPYWYIFYRECFVVWDESHKRVYKTKLNKVYIPKNNLKEALQQNKILRNWPKLTILLIRDLKRQVNHLSKKLEKASNNYDIKAAYLAESELKGVCGYLRALNDISNKVNPFDSGRLDLAQMDLSHLTVLTTFALSTKQSVGNFEFRLPKI